jgi:hypothetical protein
MAIDPYDKGLYGVTYRTLIGLHRTSPSGGGAVISPGDPAWDLWVGPLPFLLASSPDGPYIRETAPTRRDRFDQARDPGENSLDSSIWLRSWTSWHMGAGQNVAEPLETDPEIARFRFSRSAGLDVWTAGQLTLLPSMELYRSDVRKVLATPKNGVVFATTNGMFCLSESGLVSCGTNTDVVALACGQGYWVGITTTGSVVYNNYTGTDGGTISGVTGATGIGYQKNRFWAGAGNELYELTDVKASPQSLFHEFLGAAEIVDIDAGASDVYVMVEEGLTTIYAISSNSDGSLSAPVAVATLPRGERGRFLYGYLGRYLAISTDKGLRMADSGSSGVLPIGPLTIEIAGGPADVTADGNYLWVTTGSDSGVDIDAEGTLRPGTFRVDLSREVDSGPQYGDSAASRFAYATDQYAGDAASSAVPTSLTTYKGALVMSLSNSQAYVTTDNPMVTFTDADPFVRFGWYETGSVSFSTAEAKAWQSVVIEADGAGYVAGYARTGLSWYSSTRMCMPPATAST